jgi:hypothetical protein
VKIVRQVAVPDRLWGPLGTLAESLGTDREALVLQALQAFLRFHGVMGPEAPPVAPGATVPAPVPGRAAVTRRVLDTAHELERSITPGAGTRLAPILTLHGESGPLAKVDRERFLIGRGRHCDLVMESAKVSREHAVIRREGAGWWIEDLGSSNGTWFERSRVDRRRIADGDEYFICSERIKCALS